MTGLVASLPTSFRHPEPQLLGIATLALVRVSSGRACYHVAEPIPHEASTMTKGVLPVRSNRQAILAGFAGSQS